MREEKVPALLKKFLDGINKAHGAAGQLVHQHQDPRFIPVYQKLFKLREKTIGIAIKASGVKIYK